MMKVSGIVALIAALFMFSCAPPRDIVEMIINDPDLAQVEDGEYHGTYGDPTDADNPLAFVCGVTVSIQDHAYESILIIENETSERVLWATGEVVERVLEEQSLDVDTVSGATATTKTILKSIENSLAE